MNTQETSEAVAIMLKRIRQRKGLSRKQLAKECAQLGAPELSISAIGRIETGRPDSTGRRRKRISVDELFVLAHALQISPLGLLPADALRGLEQWYAAESENSVS